MKNNKHEIPCVYIDDVTLLRRFVVRWIEDWFGINGDNSKAVVGISGGIDSTLVATLCVEALGKDRVVGVMLPSGLQRDIDISKKVIATLGIECININIGDIMEVINGRLGNALPIYDIHNNELHTTNTPARLRMTMLYAVASFMNGRVANTCNFSESFVGYDTKWGDNVGDFAPIARITKTDVRRLLKYLSDEKYHFSDEIVDKIPDDGMRGQSDEEVFGFTYEQLDRHIITGTSGDEDVDYNIHLRCWGGRHKTDAVNIPHFGEITHAYVMRPVTIKENEYDG